MYLYGVVDFEKQTIDFYLLCNCLFFNHKFTYFLYED
ncbi:hypothetical protein [Bacillus sp. S2(2024)]